jgi:tetratricopeptide (TPR) repeat protein
MQIAKYLEAADSSSKINDPASAANAYRLALALDPSDLSVQESLRIAQAKASTLLADGYLKQAEYEERAERWADAARSYQKVLAGEPDNARLHDRAAHALLKAGTDLHKAAALAKRAVELNPSAARYRVTLGNIYLAAGLQLNARREIEAAASLAPDDASIGQLLARLRKS